MIGILFHGPEVFDSGWARTIVDSLARIDRIRCLLAGTMGRTAAIDSGMSGIECPGKQPSRILIELQCEADAIVFANYGKSEAAGLQHGAIIAEKSALKIPLIQAECSGCCYVEWNEGCNPAVIGALEQLGFHNRDRVKPQTAIWESNGSIYRRLTTAAAGEFVLVDGIIVGKALGGDVVFECSGRQIVDAKNIDIKPHGIEKLRRLGGIDLKTAKLASTSGIRRHVHSPQTTRLFGKGMAFVDHAGMHIYDLMQNRAGVVTVGDDTTAIVGDILYRSQIPLIGITDGDRDSLLDDTRFSPGSTVFTVPEDDKVGMRIYTEIFQNQLTIDDDFETMRECIINLISRDIFQRKDY
jgi:hypothetical protein